MTVGFTPADIRRAGARHAETAAPAVVQAQALARRAGSLTLPQCLAGQQQQISHLVSRAPAALQILADMAIAFRDRTDRAASAYEETERENTTRSQRMGGDR